MTLIESLGAACVLAGGAALVCYGRARGRAMSSSMPLASRPSHLDVGEHPVLDGRAVIRATGSSALVDALQVKLGMPAEVFEASVRPMIESYAAFVQCLAVSSMAQAAPVPILRRALRSVHAALDRRRARILPIGVAPEDIGALAHRWSYALMVVALVEVAKATLADVAVTFRSVDRPAPQRWVPAAGSLATHDALAYRYEHAADRDDAMAPLGFTLLHACVPPPVLAWLGEDARVAACLDAVLSGRADPDATLLLSLLGSSSTRSPDAPEGAVPRSRSGEEVSGERRRRMPAASDDAWVPASARHVTDHGLDEDTAAFLRWLKTALGSGQLSSNTPDSAVHGVPEGLLLVTPQINTAYAKAQRADPVRAATFSDTAERLRTIQRSLAGSESPVGSFSKVAFELREPGVDVRRIAGIVLREPERFGIQRPAVNAALLEVASDLL